MLWLRSTIARNFDPGVLVPAATTSTSTSSVPVLVIAKTDRLRVYVYVPQSDASLVRLEDPAQITFDELPGRVFSGQVSRFSRALDAATRTMLTEIDLPNSDQALLPGMYAQVRLTRKQLRPYPTVSDEALVFQNEKVFVPIVTAENRIHLQPVTLNVLKDLDQPSDRRVAAAATLGIKPKALHLRSDHRLAEFPLQERLHQQHEEIQA